MLVHSIHHPLKRDTTLLWACLRLCRRTILFRPNAIKRDFYAKYLDLHRGRVARDTIKVPEVSKTLNTNSSNHAGNQTISSVLSPCIHWFVVVPHIVKHHLEDTAIGYKVIVPLQSSYLRLVFL